MEKDALTYQTPPKLGSRFRHYYLVCLAWTAIPYAVVIFFLMYTGTHFAALASNLGLTLSLFSAKMIDLVLLLRLPWAWPLLVFPLALMPLIPASFCERQRARGDRITTLRYYRLALLILFCLAFAIMAIAFGSPLLQLLDSISGKAP